MTHEHPKRWWLTSGLPWLFAIALISPLAWMAADRTPPQTRLFGETVPSVVERGGAIRVKYWTTKRVRPDCPGSVQQEIVDSRNTIYSKLARQVGPARWESDPDNAERDIFYGHPILIPEQIASGPATLRTATFRYCNILQRLLHWPIVQVGPDIKFTVILRSGESEEGRR